MADFDHIPFKKPAIPSLSRRAAAALIVGAAAAGTSASVLAGSAIAESTPDPILAVIQRHKDLWRAFGTAELVHQELSQALPRERRSWHWELDERIPPDDPKS